MYSLAIIVCVFCLGSCGEELMCQGELLLKLQLDLHVVLHLNRDLQDMIKFVGLAVLILVLVGHLQAGVVSRARCPLVLAQGLVCCYFIIYHCSEFV